ncbi:hypothetical protein BT96DRAFT_922958 [Gymnopus androsaceus JB14]|uniref:Uncharacterized protein n=1 Tax=Gymnopus androsaceus JB14 TaxID=1447944 RepID=A0A6A4HC28_9AGAR|nr:hypothetical protein BT96DRAFT_922958 [Gymnopus androsaceus JB14]
MFSHLFTGFPQRSFAKSLKLHVSLIGKSFSQHFYFVKFVLLGGRLFWLTLDSGKPRQRS